MESLNYSTAREILNEFVMESVDAAIGALSGAEQEELLRSDASREILSLCMRESWGQHKEEINRLKNTLSTKLFLESEEIDVLIEECIQNSISYLYQQYSGGH